MFAMSLICRGESKMRAGIATMLARMIRIVRLTRLTRRALTSVALFYFFSFDDPAPTLFTASVTLGITSVIAFDIELSFSR